MKLNTKSLQKLRFIINADGSDDYRSGYAIVAFFNELGFNYVYKFGFPSRWMYTDEKLQIMNSAMKIGYCI